MKIFEKFRVNLFTYIKDLIDKKRKNLFLLVLLSIFSLLFRFVIFLRNSMYNLGLFKSTKVKSKVISIGNIVAGGVGKTPFLIFLAKKLISKNKIAIISRGYRSKFEKKSLHITKESIFTYKDIGDEPMLIKNHIKDVSIFIGREKLLSAKKASDLNFDITLVDDGFQYRKLKKDLEIVILNAKEPFGKNNFLPRGYLRESPKNLKRADYIIINNATTKLKDLENTIKKYTNCPIIYTKPTPSKFRDLSKKSIEIEKKSKVALFCGIANPELFKATIEDMGFDVVNTLYLLDHEKISLEKLNDFINKSFQKNANYILTTEKDAVALNPNIQSNLRILYLEIVLKVIDNQKHLDSLVEKIHEIC